jgi:hypothetical protein
MLLGAPVECKVGQAFAKHKLFHRLLLPPKSGSQTNRSAFSVAGDQHTPRATRLQPRALASQPGTKAWRSPCS